jgi:2-polyprenyl-3-methyl-5-hydroxy-6-metoxy-1,4-benzoquinol methylase
MDGKCGYKSFAAFCMDESRRMKRHGDGYVESNLGRFYETFLECARVLPPGAKTLSAGAGGAYVEKYLAHACEAQVTVVDFPQAIEAHAEDYRRYGFDTIGMDLAGQQRPELDERFDAVLSFEVLEHLPVSPHEHIGFLSGLLGPGGCFLLSTPNMAHLPNVLRLLRGRPLLPSAKLTFSPVVYENEYIHRREYVAAEIAEAMREAGLTQVKTAYLSGRRRGTLKGLIRRLYDLKPRWKKILLLTGRKEPQQVPGACPSFCVSKNGTVPFADTTSGATADAA